MIKFNTILEGEGVDPARVMLVRHKAIGAYELWLSILGLNENSKIRL